MTAELKAKKLNRGDTVGIVSLSSGVLGEPFVQHEVRLIEERLTNELSLRFKYMDNARKGLDFLREHPEARAEDLKQAFLDPEVKMIWCAIGGEDTFRLLPYLDNEEFKEIVRVHPKIFMGFSDTTNNHLLLYKLGLRTFYGPALLPDVAELGPEMLPYTRAWIERLFGNPAAAKIDASPVWYKPREKFDESRVGVAAQEIKETRGMIFLGANKKVKGRLLGGCIDSLYEMIAHTRFPEEQKKIFGQYPIFPTKEEWAGKILFIESSEEQPKPELYKKMIQVLERLGVFDAVVGVLVGKPMDEKYFAEYQAELARIGEKYQLPIVYNLNFGHGAPRMILPYGELTEIDPEKREVWFREKMLED